MNLYLCEDGGDYDEYDEIVVRAANPEEALRMVTTGYDRYRGYKDTNSPFRGFHPDTTKVTEIPLDGEPEIICTSYNAG